MANTPEMIDLGRSVFDLIATHFDNDPTGQTTLNGKCGVALVAFVRNIGALEAAMEWDHRYRMLEEGEIIQIGDEVLTDSHLGWQAAKHAIGQPAPNPYYTAHRMYRRALTAPSASAQGGTQP